MSSLQVGDVIDLRVPRSALVKRQKGGVLPMLEGWVLRRAEPGGGLPGRSWSRVTRILLPVTFEELDTIVRAYAQSGTRFWDEFANLSTYQQRQIDRLLEDKRSDDPDHRYEWILAAIKTDPVNAKKMNIENLQVIIQRRLRVGALALAANGRKVHRQRKVQMWDSGEEDDNEEGDPKPKPRKPPGSKPPSQDVSPSSAQGMLQRSKAVDPHAQRPSHDGLNAMAPEPLPPHPHQPEVIIPQQYVPLRTSDPPSISPYLLRHNQVQKGTDNSLPKFLEWVVRSRKKGRRHRPPSPDDEEQRYADSRPTGDLLRHGITRGRETFGGRGNPDFTQTQTLGDEHLWSLMNEYMQQQRYGSSSLPHDAYQYRQDQRARHFSQPHIYDFDQQAMYGDREEPLRLLPAPRQATTTHDNRARNLAVDAWDPAGSTMTARNQQHADPHTLIEGGDVDFRAGSGHIRGFHRRDNVAIDDQISALGTEDFERTRLHRARTPHVHRNPSERADPVLDNNLIAKYTALDEHYPSEGESMHILREEDPADKSGSRHRDDSEGGSSSSSSSSSEVVIRTTDQERNRSQERQRQLKKGTNLEHPTILK